MKKILLLLMIVMLSLVSSVGVNDGLVLSMGFNNKIDNNYNNLKAGYQFEMFKNSTDIEGNYNGLDTSLIYNSDGVYFNPDNSPELELPLLGINGSHSICTKFKFNRINDGQTAIFNIGDGWDNNVSYLLLQSTGRLSWALGNGTTVHYIYVFYPNIDEWYDICLTLDEEEGEMNFYSDGVLVDTDTFIGSFINYDAKSWIGSRSGFGSYSINGTIAYTYVFDKVLSIDEVQDINNYALHNTPDKVSTQYVLTTNGSVAAYSFKTSQDSKDILGNHDGIDTNMAYSSNGAEFSGVNSWINTSISSELNNDFSICTKIKFNSCNQGYDRIISVGDVNSSINLWRRCSVDSLLQLKIRNESNYVLNLFSIYPLNDNQDYDVCITKNNNNISIYINGEINNSVTQSLGIFDISSNYPLLIGSLNSAPTTYEFNGSMEYMYIYNYTLSAGEIINNITQDTDLELSLDLNNDINDNVNISTQYVLYDDDYNNMGAQSAWYFRRYGNANDIISTRNLNLGSEIIINNEGLKGNNITNSYASVSNLNVKNDHSVCLRIKFDSINSVQTGILNTGYGWDNNISYLLLQNTGRLSWALGNGTTVHYIYGFYPNINEWYDICYELEIPGNTMKLWVNGILNGTTQFYGTFVEDDISGVLGARDIMGGSYSLNGTIDWLLFRNADVQDTIIENLEVVSKSENFLFKTAQNSVSAWKTVNGIETGCTYGNEGISCSAGSGGIIELNNNITLGASDWSLAFKMKHNATDYTGLGEFIVSTNAGTDPRCYFRNNNTIKCYDEAHIGLQTGIPAWTTETMYNYVLIYHENNHTLSAYINGEWYSSTANTFGSNFYFDKLFYNGNSTYEYFYVYNRALTETEIIKLNNSGNYIEGRDGETNGAFSFRDNDGINKGFEFIATNHTAQGYEELTLSFWTKTLEALQFGADIGSSEKFLMYMKNGWEPTIYLNEEVTQESDLYNTFNDNNWHNTVVTFNGTTTKIFVDGTLTETEDNTPLSVGYIDVNNNVTYIGIQNDWNDGGDLGQGLSTGYLDDLRIWSRALSDNEVNNYYTDELFNTITYMSDEIGLIYNQGNYTSDGLGESDSVLYKNSVYRFGNEGGEYIITNYTPHGLTEITFSAWINVTQGGVANVIYGAYNGSSNWLSSYITDNGKFSSTFNGCLGGTIADEDFWFNTFHHVATSVDSNGTMKLYVDGNLNVTKQCGAIGTVNVDDYNLYIGAYNHVDKLTYPFSGTIDEFNFYERALNEYEIKNLYGMYDKYDKFVNSGVLFKNQTNSSFELNSPGYYLEPDMLCNYLVNDTGLTCYESNSNISCFPAAGTVKDYVLTAYCNDSETFGNIYDLTPYAIYTDLVLPLLNYTFEERVYFENNITGQFNFSDNLLFGWNISLDGVTLASAENVGYNSYVYNLSIDPNTLDAGEHTIGVWVADGHTSKKIDKYKVSKGLLNTHLEFNTGKNKINIQAEDGSIFDSYSADYNYDRHTFTYNPFKKSKNNQYSFIVESEKPLIIVNHPETKYNLWLISGDNWIDFYADNLDNSKIKITLIDDYHAKVTIQTNGKDKIEFQSIGDLNIEYQEFTFESVNYGVSFTEPERESEDTEYLLTVNISGTSYDFNDITAVVEINGTNYSVIKNQADGIIYFSKEYTTPNTDVNLTLENIWYIETTNDNTTHYFNQTIIPNIYNLEFRREQTDSLFNFTETGLTNYSVYLDMYCDESKTRYEITQAQSTINDSNCDPNYWYIILESSTDSYFRTIIPDFSLENHTIYLLDLKDDSAVEIIFLLNDLINQYGSGYLIAKKFIGSNLVNVIKQGFDIETRVIFWLDENEQYEIYAENNDGQVVRLNTMVADSAGTKALILPGLPFYPTNDVDDVWWDIVGNKDTGVANLYYRDITPGGFNVINWTVSYYSNNSVYASVQYLAGNNATLQVTGLNRSKPYISRIYIDHTLSGYDLITNRILWWGDKTVFDGFEDITPDLKLWFATGVVAILFMIGTVGSSVILSAIGLLLAFLFTGIGWFDSIATVNALGIELPLFKTLLVIFSVLMAFQAWRKMKREG